MTKLAIATITGEYATTSEMGQTLHDRICPILKAGNAVELDFDGVKIFTANFFNYSIGQLLNQFSPDDLNARLTLSNLPAYEWSVVRAVVANAKKSKF